MGHGLVAMLTFERFFAGAAVVTNSVVGDPNLL